MSKRKCSLNDDLKAEFSFLSSGATDGSSLLHSAISTSQLFQLLTVAGQTSMKVNMEETCVEFYDRQKSFKKHTLRC